MESARVTVLGADARFDVALPALATVAELLPQLTRMARVSTRDLRGQNEWLLTRLDGEVLPPGRTVESLAIRNGELLCLKPGDPHETGTIFDDAVTAIGLAVSGKPDRWAPGMGRRAGLAAEALLLAAGAATAAVAGPPWLPVAAVCLAVAAAGLCAAVVLARGYGDDVAAAVTGGGAVLYAFIGGLVAGAPAGGMAGAGRTQLSIACAALMIAAAVCAVTVNRFAPVFLSAAMAGGLGEIASAASSLTNARAGGVAAVTAAAVLALSPLLPVISLRLARQPLPALPATAAELRHDDQPPYGPEALERARLADSYLTALVAACAAVAATAGIITGLSGSAAGKVMAAAVAAALLLRSRIHSGAPQRTALLVAGLADVVALLAGSTVTAASPHRVLAGLAAFAVAAAVALGAGLAAPRQRVSPYWGRFIDITEIALLVSLVPLALAVLGVYQHAQHVMR